jgi:RimJ/RimL family protein N-acetyltransferase
MGQAQRFGEPLPDWTPPRAPDWPVLEGAHVRIERLDPARHTGDLARAMCPHPELWDYMPQGPFTGEADLRAWAEAVAPGADPWFVAILDRHTGRAVGHASYLRITPAAGSIEVGYIAFSPALQRTPAATEAMFLMADWVFGAGYRRYEWKCDALNLPSRRAAIRFGFSYEGIFRQATIVKGRNRDTAWFAMIDKDWSALRGAYKTWLDPANFDAQGQQRQRLSDLTAPSIVMADPGI